MLTPAHRQADIECSNGLIHIVDAVMIPIPPPPPSVRCCSAAAASCPCDARVRCASLTRPRCAERRRLLLLSASPPADSRWRALISRHLRSPCVAHVIFIGIEGAGAPRGRRFLLCVVSSARHPYAPSVSSLPARALLARSQVRNATDSVGSEQRALPRVFLRLVCVRLSKAARASQSASWAAPECRSRLQGGAYCHARTPLPRAAMRELEFVLDVDLSPEARCPLPSGPAAQRRR